MPMYFWRSPMPENAAPEINQKIIFHDAAGEFDETWLKGVDVHIERMNETGFWIGFDFPDGRRVMLNTGVYRGEWYFNLEEDALGDHQSASVCRPRNATKSAALVKANNDIHRLTESRDAISALFPEDAAHKHPESGVSLLDDVRDVIAKYAELRKDRDLLDRIEEFQTEINQIEPASAFPDRKWTIYMDDENIYRGSTFREAMYQLDAAMYAPTQEATCKESLQVQPPARHGKDGNGDQLRDTTKVISSPAEPSGNTTLEADNRRLRELLKEFHELADHLKIYTAGHRRRVAAALQPAATQPSGNTGEFKCATCRDKKQVPFVYGQEYDCVMSTTKPCPDCSATQPATEQPTTWLCLCRLPLPRHGAETDDGYIRCVNCKRVWTKDGKSATEQPRIWRVAFRDKKGRQYSEFQRTEELADLHVEWHRTQTVLGPTFDVRKQYSTDNGETWVDEQAGEPGKVQAE